MLLFVIEFCCILLWFVLLLFVVADFPFAKNFLFIILISSLFFQRLPIFFLEEKSEVNAKINAKRQILELRGLKSEKFQFFLQKVHQHLQNQSRRCLKNVFVLLFLKSRKLLLWSRLMMLLKWKLKRRRL